MWEENSVNSSSQDRSRLKLPNNDNKKKKITKNSHSHKEINQIYQSISNLMRQAHKEMNPVTAAALTTALVWSSILDAMLVRAHADSNCRSSLELQKPY
jgi:hypothetical protein